VLEPGIGYVKLSSLPAGRAAEAREAINQLTAKGVKRLVLDLRGAALGSLEEGAAVADLFIDEGVVARKVGRGGVDAALIKASREATVFRGPLSVLVDYSTAGGAEVTAAALLQSGRGVLVGAKTFGAGVELGMFPLRDGGALLLTVARFADPQGRPFVVEPVAPTNLVERAAAELVVPDEDDDGDAEDAAVEDLAPKQTPPEDDVQLKKAVELLKASEFPAARAA
jgi:carboxyl-terminal processing protease